MAYDDYYAQVYYFENGNRGTMIIPKDATEDDLLALKEIIDIVIKRHYKQADTPQTEVTKEEFIEQIKDARLEIKPLNDCEITECDYHKYCKERGQTDCGWK